jgi:hypothetical protein
MIEKLLNFLVNEDEKGSEQMMEWKFGGHSDVDKRKYMAVLDLMPLCLEKMKSDHLMRKQYQEMASIFGVESYYILMIIPYCFLQMHVLLFQKTKEDGGVNAVERMQVHVASSATADYAFGLGRGTEKYTLKIVTPHVSQTWGLHAQGWLMNVTKGKEHIYPKALRRLMARHIVEVYSNVYDFDAEFVSQIVEIFGCSGSSIDLGLYNHMAKEFDDADLLHLDEQFGDDLEQDEIDYARSQLSIARVDEAVITFFLGELKATRLSSLMSRIRSFRDAQRQFGMYVRVAKILDDANLLNLDEQMGDDLEQDEIDYARSQLSNAGVDEEVINFFELQLKAYDLAYIMDLIRKIRAGQRMQYIASQLPPDTTNSLSDLPDEGMRLLIRGLSTTLGQDPDVVLGKLQRMKIAQDMQFVASKLPDITSSFSELPPDVHSMVTELSIKLDETTDVVLGKLQRMKKAQDNNGEMMSSLHHLAKVFNNATGDIEDRQNEVRKDPRFKSFMNASGRDCTSATDCKAAIEAVMKTAHAYDKTFWKYFAKLVAYIGEHPDDFVTTGGVKVLIIDSRNKEKEYDHLKRWLEVMNGYSNHKNYTENAYGLKAYEMMGSIEQLALAEKYVCFDPVLYGEAYVIFQERKCSSNQRDLLSDLFSF